ncbi:MAG: TldD/PmbA family protein [Bacteroidales bacterium]|nr:TldD/PmbA family protein [Bacteroidales bacterium]
MNHFFELFKITKEQLILLMEEALASGGDYADIFCEYSTQEVLTLRDGEVNTIRNDIDFGAGIRVIRDGRTGYAYSESTDMKHLRAAAQAAARIAESTAGERITAPFTPLKLANYYSKTYTAADFDVFSKKGYLKEIHQRLSDGDNRIVQIVGQSSSSLSKIMFFNSLGEFYCDERPLTSVTFSAIFSQNGVTDNYTCSKSFRMGNEMFTPTLADEIVNEILEAIPTVLEAVRPQGGEMMVVMGAGGSGILLHEAIGHAFEADFNRKGISIFSDKMGEKICSESISIADDATISANRGSLNVDDEGVPGQKTMLITEGILTSYLHDRISARHYKVAPTGNGRRESFRFEPIPRMRATYMENGSASTEDIISSVRKGIYVDKFRNGQVQIGAGDFTFFVKSGRMIENGRLTHPIKDINVIGNGPRALADILEVASDGRMEDGTWTCGKGQQCPVSCGMPTVLVKSLTVGGSN